MPHDASALLRKTLENDSTGYNSDLWGTWCCNTHPSGGIQVRLIRFCSISEREADILWIVSSVGEYLYAFDLSTLRLCPYAPGHAIVLGCFEEKLPKATIGGHLTLQVDHCPRTILKRAIE
jgi:hypothetical protein